MGLWFILATVAQDAPSNDEMMGFVIVFGFIGLVAFIAYAFGPKPTLPPLPEPGSSGSGYGCVVAGCIIIGLVLYAFASSAGAAHH